MRPPTIPAPEGFYGCTACRTVKPLSEFYHHPGKTRPFSHCKECKRSMKRAKERLGKTEDPTGADRFWAKVRKGDGCWEWLGTKRHGHGHFYYKGKMRRAHRVSLELAGRPAPDDMHVDHTCRNRSCVNPDHLRVVTPGQNALENNDSPFAANHHAKECKRGHSLTDEANLAIRVCVGPKGSVMLTRICLTCEPSHWRYAIVKRDPPANAKFGSRGDRWLGPQTVETHGARAKALWAARPSRAR